MNDFETRTFSRNFSNDAHIDNETSNEANLGEILPNEANISETSEREINLYLSRFAQERRTRELSSVEAPRVAEYTAFYTAIQSGPRSRAEEEELERAIVRMNMERLPVELLPPFQISFFCLLFGPCQQHFLFHSSPC